MILVVADTGPLHYLVVIESIELLPRLYERIVIPSEVLPLYFFGEGDSDRRLSSEIAK
jgi:predicted nucleic acid-binding protein